MKVFASLSAKRRAFEEEMRKKKEAEEAQALAEAAIVEEAVEEVKEEAPIEPQKDPVVVLLEEIRDSLKAKETVSKPKAKAKKTPKSE